MNPVSKNTCNNNSSGQIQPKKGFWGRIFRKIMGEKREPAHTFADLPKEIVFQIFSNLSAKDLSSCRLVCKEWKEIASSKELWVKHSMIEPGERRQKYKELEKLLEIWVKEILDREDVIDRGNPERVSYQITNSYRSSGKNKQLGGSCELDFLPDVFGFFTEIEYLEIYFSRNFRNIPESFDKLLNLKTLVLHLHGYLVDLSILKSLKNLETLKLSLFHLSELPETTRSLVNLKSLEISLYNNLFSLPSWIKELENLETLIVEGEGAISDISKDIINLKQLKVLKIKLARGFLPPIHLFQIPNLKCIDLQANRWDRPFTSEEVFAIKYFTIIKQAVDPEFECLLPE